MSPATGGDRSADHVEAAHQRAGNDLTVRHKWPPRCLLPDSSRPAGDFWPEVLAFAYLDSVRRASLPIVETLTASTRIPAGTLITQDMIVVRLYPANLLPGGSLSRLEQAVGRTSQVAIEEAEVILESKLRRGATGGLAPLLPPEHHAMLLPAGWLAGAAPPLATGDRIDILAVHAQSAESGVLLSDIEVHRRFREQPGS